MRKSPAYCNHGIVPAAGGGRGRAKIHVVSVRSPRGGMAKKAGAGALGGARGRSDACPGRQRDLLVAVRGEKPVRRPPARAAGAGQVDGVRRVVA